MADGGPMTQEKADAAARRLDGARLVVWNLVHRARDVSEMTGYAAAGTEAYAHGVPAGQHAKLTDLLSPDDAAKWGRIAKFAGNAGDALQLGIAFVVHLAVAELARRVIRFDHGGSGDVLCRRLLDQLRQDQRPRLLRISPQPPP